jgi:hypothetical protein
MDFNHLTYKFSSSFSTIYGMVFLPQRYGLQGVFFSLR